MTTPPIPPGPPGPYGQGQPGQPPGYGPPPPHGPPGQPHGHPAGRPPQRGGVPVWAWILGAVLALLLVCVCGGVGLYTVLDDEPTGTASTSETSEPTEPTTEATTEPTTTPVPSPTSSPLPPTPAGSTPNTDTSKTLSADDLESQIAGGMSGFGHTKDDITCTEDLVLVKDRTATCTAPVPDSDRRSDVITTVGWANTTSTQLRYYLTFRQDLG